MFDYCGTEREDWEDRIKPNFIKLTVQDICANIAKKGDDSSFPEIFEKLYEHIEDNLEKFSDIFGFQPKI